MTDEMSTSLSFERTDDQGNLIIKDSVSGNEFVLPVTDELEQGILAAKQTLRELEGTPQPQIEKALPISTIQSLLRAGCPPEKIAHDFNISLAIVHRFASPISTEKKFILAQFLDTSIPVISSYSHENEHVKVSDAIESSMASMAVDYATIQWSATREGNSPWHIQAQYSIQGNKQNAEWFFNSREHSVVCANTAAKHLFGEASSSISPVDNELFSTDAVPVVSSQNMEQSQSQQFAQTPSENTSSTWDAVSTRTGTFENVNISVLRSNTRLSTGAFNTIMAGTSTSQDTEKLMEPETFQPHITRPHTKPQVVDNVLFGDETDSTSSEETQDVPESPEYTVTENEEKNQPSDSDSTLAKKRITESRKKKRSVIPAWDEILFGSHDD